MKDFDELKNIWQQQKVTLATNPEELIAKAKKSKRDFNAKITIQLVTLLLSMIVVGYVGITIPFEQKTTYAGIVLILITVFGFSAVRIYQMLQLQKIDLTQTPEHTLPKLETAVRLQKMVSTKLMTAYMLLLNLAMGLYFIEVMHPMSTSLKAICLTVYIAWMLIAYFYLGKKQKIREEQRLQDIINTIKQVQNDFQ